MSIPGTSLKSLFAVFVCSLIAGCSEITTINTNPPGARVTVNGRMIGMTPLTYEVSRSEWPANNRFRYTMELRGFETKEGEFQGRVTPGRVIGSILTTAGLSLIGGAMTLPEVEVDLQPIGTSEATGQAKPPVAERLQHVNDLYDQGLISDQERRRLRSEILSEEP